MDLTIAVGTRNTEAHRWGTDRIRPGWKAAGRLSSTLGGRMERYRFPGGLYRLAMEHPQSRFTALLGPAC
jgi:hypothetical protein